jgi:uncharacterized protein (DUF2336 family)
MSSFALLRDLSNRSSSEERRELLRQVTDTLTIGPAASAKEVAELDQLLALVAKDFSSQVRSDLARVLARDIAKFSNVAEQLALDEIDVAEPILRHAPVLRESTLLEVVNTKSQQHMMLVSKRPDVTSSISSALVEKGEDDVVLSLLKNELASIAPSTYEVIAERADRSDILQAPLVRRRGLPLNILSGLYLKVEAELRKEIISKLGAVPESELTAAFAISRASVTTKYRDVPGDFEPARRRVRALASQGKLLPPVLMTLLREGTASRTAFVIAFSDLAEVDYEVVQQTVDPPDLDALALICRGVGFERALFTSLAVGLDKSEAGLSRALEYGSLFESVTTRAAERAMRFWKLRQSTVHL